MESKRCGYTLFGGIVVILALCSISTVRGDDWDDELEFATDKSEARLLNLNSTSLPDSYVSHFWFKALSIGFWSNVVHTKISFHESSTCVYRWNIMYIKTSFMFLWALLFVSWPFYTLLLHLPLHILYIYSHIGLDVDKGTVRQLNISQVFQENPCSEHEEQQYIITNLLCYYIHNYIIKSMSA